MLLLLEYILRTSSLRIFYYNFNLFFTGNECMVEEYRGSISSRFLQDVLKIVENPERLFPCGWYLRVCHKQMIHRYKHLESLLWCVINT